MNGSHGSSRALRVRAVSSCCHSLAMPEFGRHSVVERLRLPPDSLGRPLSLSHRLLEHLLEHPRPLPVPLEVGQCQHDGRGILGGRGLLRHERRFDGAVKLPPTEERPRAGDVGASREHRRTAQQNEQNREEGSHRSHRGQR